MFIVPRKDLKKFRAELAKSEDDASAHLDELMTAHAEKGGKVQLIDTSGNVLKDYTKNLNKWRS